MMRTHTHTHTHHQLTLYRYDELGYDGEDLWSTVLQHVVHSLPGKELVGVAGLTEPVKEEGQVVVVVQLLNLHLQDTTGQ